MSPASLDPIRGNAFSISDLGSSELPDGDFDRLWAAFRDLAAISALHLLWIEREPQRLAAELCDTAVRLLGVDAALVTIEPDPHDTALRTRAARPGGHVDPATWELLERAIPWRGHVPSLDVTVERASLNARGPLKRISVASRRPDFPTKVEQFLLRTLANEASIALRERELREAERSARLEAEEAARRMAVLQRTTAELAEPLPRAEVGALFLKACAEALEARVGAVVALVEGQPQEIAQIGLSESAPPELVAPTADDDAGEAILHAGQSVMIHLRTALGPVGRAWLTVPQLTKSDRYFLLALAHETSHALERCSARLAAEASSGAREAFIGVVSHELRTPITTVLGASAMIRRLGRDDPRREELLDDLAVEAERLSRIVENLLIVSKIEHGTLDVLREPVLLTPLAAAIALDEGRHAPHADIRVEADPGVPPVLGERTSIEQVLRNLVNNAVKYAGPRATVRIRIRPDGEVVRVEVEDDGPGITTADAARVFDLFFRSERAARAAGAGIGLFVCHALINAMRGRIWVEPSARGGTQFAFTLEVCEG